MGPVEEAILAPLAWVRGVGLARGRCLPELCTTQDWSGPPLYHQGHMRSAVLGEAMVLRAVYSNPKVIARGLVSGLPDFC